jgi:plasmid stabilization system protein ParE
MRIVEWSPKAEADYYSVIDYLLKNWSVNEAQNFIDQVYGMEHILRQGNVDFKKVGYRNIRIATLSKHNSVLYNILSPKRIKIITIWDNRRNASLLYKQS